MNFDDLEKYLKDSKLPDASSFKWLYKLMEYDTSKIDEALEQLVLSLQNSEELDRFDIFKKQILWYKELLNNREIATDSLISFIGLVRSKLELADSSKIGDGDFQDLVEAVITNAEPENIHHAWDKRKKSSIDYREYLEHIFNYDKLNATRFILEAIEANTSVKEIYLEVFQPALWEIGRLWQTNKISVAEEHYATAVTQLIMGQLFPKIISAEKLDKVLIASCVGDELHEIGIRMVADFFEMAGWDTYYLGANSPVKAISDLIRKKRADLLAISVTNSAFLLKARNVITEIKKIYRDHVKIIVGGRAFNLSTDVWKAIGADGYAQDANSAVEYAHNLLEKAKRQHEG